MDDFSERIWFGKNTLNFIHDLVINYRQNTLFYWVVILLGQTFSGVILNISDQIRYIISAKKLGFSEKYLENKEFLTIYDIISSLIVRIFCFSEQEHLSDRGFLSKIWQNQLIDKVWYSIRFIVFLFSEHEDVRKYTSDKSNNIISYILNLCHNMWIFWDNLWQNYIQFIGPFLPVYYYLFHWH